MLNVIRLNVIMPSVIMLLCSVSFILIVTYQPFRLSVIMLNVVMLNVVIPIVGYAQCLLFLLSHTSHLCRVSLGRMSLY
jgi:hypothetical protein